MLYINNEGFHVENGSLKHARVETGLIDPSEVKTVQADGDELECIFSQFGNIPYNTRARVMRWTGEWARFIACNLA